MIVLPLLAPRGFAACLLLPFPEPERLNEPHSDDRLSAVSNFSRRNRQTLPLFRFDTFSPPARLINLGVLWACLLEGCTRYSVLLLLINISLLIQFLEYVAICRVFAEFFFEELYYRTPSTNAIPFA